MNFIRSFFTRPASPNSIMAAKTKAQSIIDSNPVAIFSKSYCPYCKATKQLLSEMGAKANILELDQIGMLKKFPKEWQQANNPADDGAALQDALQEITGQRSVPNIFIAQKHIGGNSELQAKKSELPNLLKEAGAV